MTQKGKADLRFALEFGLGGLCGVVLLRAGWETTLQLWLTGLCGILLGLLSRLGDETPPTWTRHSRSAVLITALCWPWTVGTTLIMMAVERLTEETPDDSDS